MYHVHGDVISPTIRAVEAQAVVAVTAVGQLACILAPVPELRNKVKSHGDAIPTQSHAVVSRHMDSKKMSSRNKLKLRKPRTIYDLLQLT